MRVHGVTYTSVGGLRIGGWLALPAEGPVRNGFVVGHGYGGRQAPGPRPPAAAGRVRRDPAVRTGDGGVGPEDGIPGLAAGHVLHGIGSRSTYVVDDCAADWKGARAAGDQGLAGKRWHPRRPHTVTPRMASPRNARRVNMRANQPWGRSGRSDRREF